MSYPRLPFYFYLRQERLEVVDGWVLLCCDSRIVVIGLVLGVFNLFIRQLDVVDNHVHALDIQARHALDGVDDVAADSLSQFVDGDTVFRDDGDLHGGHAFFYRDGDSLADVFIAAEGLTDGAYQAGAAATEGSNAGYLTRSDAGDLGDNSIIDGGGTVLGFQVLIDLAWAFNRISGCAGGCFR